MYLSIYPLNTVPEWRTNLSGQSDLKRPENGRGSENSVSYLQEILQHWNNLLTLYRESQGNYQECPLELSHPMSTTLQSLPLPEYL